MLNSYSKNGVNANFVYDKDKLLTKKTVGDVVTDYIWFDGKLIQEKTGDETIKYYYGADGLKGFSHSTKGNFYYRKNVLGDIIEIIDSFGTVKGKYSYTAFGECTILEDVNGIATANPFRYRGYYYDSTTNFYYLKSRYYDPVVCRFITFDDLQYLDPEHIGGLNLYAYCNNNPIMYVDPDGTKIIDIKKIYKVGKKIWKKIKKGVGVGVTYVKNVVTDVKDYFVYKVESGINYIREKTWKGKFFNFNINIPENWYEFWNYSFGFGFNVGDFSYSMQIGLRRKTVSLGYKDTSCYWFAGLLYFGGGVSNTQNNVENYSEFSISTISFALAFVLFLSPFGALAYA